MTNDETGRAIPAALVELATDRRRLTTAAYADSGNLAARQAIYVYQQPPVDLVGWVLGQVTWTGGEVVLDIGCGNGLYLRRLAGQTPAPRHLLGFDLSRGMLADVQRDSPGGAVRPRLAVADLQALPLPEASLDVALAMHMLYHVPDMARGVSELRRVLRPGGRLLVATNGERHLAELDDLIEHAMERLAGQPLGQRRQFSRRFSLENGAAVLAGAFGSVERREAASTLVIPTVAPLERYVASSRSLLEPLLPAGLGWDAVVDEVARLAAAEIAARGAVRITTAVGVFIGT